MEITNRDRFAKLGLLVVDSSYSGSGAGVGQRVRRRLVVELIADIAKLVPEVE